MLSITALLHTRNDGLRLGRCLETLYPCDEILIVDHGSTDATVRIAKEYGARVVEGHPAESELNIVAVPMGDTTGCSWILCLDPHESVSESLAASLFELKSASTGSSGVQAYSVFLREETAEGWVQHPTARTRVVPAGWDRWQQNFPQTAASALVLEGELLRFVFP
jgi:glycosyltransferase involved in cell wall biosynthesis